MKTFEVISSTYCRNRPKHTNVGSLYRARQVFDRAVSILMIFVTKRSIKNLPKGAKSLKSFEEHLKSIMTAAAQLENHCRGQE